MVVSSILTAILSLMFISAAIKKAKEKEKAKSKHSKQEIEFILREEMLTTIPLKYWDREELLLEIQLLQARLDFYSKNFGIGFSTHETDPTSNKSNKLMLIYSDTNSLKSLYIDLVSDYNSNLLKIKKQRSLQNANKKMEEKQ